jgi:hypothetical protein
MDVPNISLPLTGGCLCGAIRYEITSKPLLMFLCHCYDCQRASGAASVPVAFFKAKAFKLTQGELTFFSNPRLEGGRHMRGFCATCGSRLTGGQQDGKENHFIGVTAGSLDDSSWFRPQQNIFASQAQPWDLVDRSLPTHENSFPKRD